MRVLSGIPEKEAIRIAVEAAVSAAKPWMGSSLVRRKPSVFIVYAMIGVSTSVRP